MPLVVFDGQPNGQVATTQIQAASGPATGKGQMLKGFALATQPKISFNCPISERLNIIWWTQITFKRG